MQVWTGSDFGEYRFTIKMRQRQIEHDQVRPALLQRQQRHEPVVGNIDVKACKSQCAAVHSGAGVVVFDDENAVS